MVSISARQSLTKSKVCVLENERRRAVICLVSIYPDHTGPDSDASYSPLFMISHKFFHYSGYHKAALSDLC